MGGQKLFDHITRPKGQAEYGLEYHSPFVLFECFFLYGRSCEYGVSSSPTLCSSVLSSFGP